jgi:XTP/dITP diphosphohydrolase
MNMLLLATGNPGKRREMQVLLAALGEIDLITPEDIGVQLVISEHGATYAENAALKARAYAEASGLPSLADDSGLEVEALRGAPGLHSARYLARPGATDADRRAYLLEQLRGIPRPWLACFRCSVAVAQPGDELRTFEGMCPGEIIPEERGVNGFGYDPIFQLSDTGRTMAELSMEEKNRLSHRAKAVQAALPYLHTLL